MTSDFLSTLSGEDRARLHPSSHPRWVDPMLATLTEDRFSDPDWLFERKLDGIRCLAFREGGELRLLSRNKQRLDNTYPELTAELAEQRADDFVVDGEVVALEHGRISFALLQQRSGITDPARARRSPVEVRYYVFDVLHLERHDTRALPLRSRKRLLKATLSFEGPLRYTTHRNARGEEYLDYACEHGWEGLIAKKADSTYTSRRSSNWLKLKCASSQEFVIGGFTEPRGSRVGLGALVVGYFEGDRFLRAGKVGTGFDDRTLRELRADLEELEIERSPFTDSPHLERGTHFVVPTLVAEVGFTEWTRDGMLRHPRFLGLRRDKKAGDVVREMPAARARKPR